MQLFSEAKILEALSHPNIIKLYEFYKTKSNKLVLILEYAEGDDLHKKIIERRENYFSEKEVKKWIFQLSIALKHSHDHKILHRDLKTTNIFLDKINNIKLGDFGLAKNVGKIEFSLGGMLGTPVYLAPEVIEHSKVSLKSDVWSLGIVFYEIMSLNFPFFAADLSTLIKKICNDDLEELPNVFSQDLKDFVFWILNKDPEKRPSITEICKSDFFSLIHKDIFGEKVFDKIKIKSDFRISENGLRRDFKELKIYRHSEYKKTIDLQNLNNNNQTTPKASVFKKNQNNSDDQLLEESDVFSNSSFVQKIKSNNKINEIEESKLANSKKNFNFENDIEGFKFKNHNEDLQFSDVEEFESSEILESEIKEEEKEELKILIGDNELKKLKRNNIKKINSSRVHNKTSDKLKNKYASEKKFIKKRFKSKSIKKNKKKNNSKSIKKIKKKINRTKIIK